MAITVSLIELIMCCVSSANCLVELEQNFSRHTAIASMVVSCAAYIMCVLKNLTPQGC